MLTRTDRYSHYQHDGTPVHLQKHHQDVADRSLYLTPKEATTSTGTPVSEISEIISLVHDFGKLTTAFQKHLDEKDIDENTSHSPLGAFVGFYVLKSRGYKSIDALTGFVAIAKHHGTLPDVADYVFNHVHPDQSQGSRRIPMVRAQVRDIDSNVSTLADQILTEATGGAGSWNEFAEKMVNNEWLLTILNLVTSGIGRPTSPQEDTLPVDFYESILPVWSTLTLADKTSAAALTSGAELDTSVYDGTQPSLSRLIRKIESLQSEGLNSDATADEEHIHNLRGDAHEEVMESIEDFATANTSVASLTLPTGLGKTLTGLNAGLSLLSRRSTTGRLIYALPFTSIIDQVEEKCRDMFKTNGHDEVLTVDHHLAETIIDIADLGNVDPDTVAHIEALLGDSWRSGMVITTFVQLFESLAGPSNSQSMKLPSLDESVVIIDEPQAIPEAWWPLVQRLMTMITEQYDAQIIVMTATQPKVFEQDENTTYSLIQSPEQYYSELDRVEFEIKESANTFINRNPDPLDYTTAAEKLLSDSTQEDSSLAICNTIDSARELTDALTSSHEFTSLNQVYDDYLNDSKKLTTEISCEDIVAAVADAYSSKKPVLLHLTTRHRPVDRRILITVTKQLQENRIPVYAVTTQLVEAGVDISFDRVFRDFAPMSSIVQAAGRCNRSFEHDRGTVIVWLLGQPTDSQQLPATAVYGGDNEESRPKLTAQAINSHRDNRSECLFSETTMTWDVVNEYFDRLQDRNPGRQEYVDYLLNSQISQLGRQSLITNGESVDVVVARTKTETELLDNIDEAFDDYDYDSLEKLVDQTRELQVSIPIYDESSEEAQQIAELNPVHAGSMRRQVKAKTDQYDAYSPLTGLSVPSPTVDNRFL
ncbi:CRISPR-associated endonuclease Cas3'' [Halorubrum laminariae]|uniref:CRISPR-associated endonuclease Cas3 n=1 Tax=Halorubrum laminariae TaxID=1433523 RepID=A0ABD6C3K5_9EURY|nr:CRISPR-associated endonuclease Cas3'' [Halorubrum laminariae]